MIAHKGKIRFCLVAPLLMLAFLAVRPAFAAEDEDLYGQLMKRYDIVNDELRKALADLDYESPMPGYPERMLSLRKNAEVTVGGEVRTNYIASRSKWSDPGFDPADPTKGKSESKIGDLAIQTAKLLIDARAGDRWRAFFDINLNGHHGFRKIAKLANPNKPGERKPTKKYTREEDIDHINQAYIEMMKDGHSGFGFIMGKMKLPFGLWNRPNLLAQSYLDGPNLTSSFLMGSDGWDGGAILPHASRFMDPVVAAMLNYEMRDIIRFEAAVFQDRDNNISIKDRADGTQRARSESHVPRSWQIGMSILPLEGWELTAHFRNRYSRSRGMDAWIDSPHRWDFARNMTGGSGNPRWNATEGQWTDDGDGPSFGSRSTEQSFIVGLAVEVNTKLSASVEYAHGWNQGFNRHISSDDVNVALQYRATPNLTLHAQGEWLRMRDGSWMTGDGAGGWRRDQRKNDLYRVMLGAEYELGKGLTLEAGWQYEYWRQRSTVTGERRANHSNMIYMGTRFIF